MLLILLLLFVLVPLAEFSLLFWLGSEFGLLNTILIVLGTGFLGAALAKRQGISTLTKLQQQVNAGEMPAETLFDGVLILLAGVLLITPGFLSDVTGLLLLLPPVRFFVRRFLKSRVIGRFEMRTAGGGPVIPRGDRIIDVEVVETRVKD